jgi:hypothetical protein
MILKNVTFTGADDKVNRQDLYDISAKHPSVEWGILWYPKKMGSPRYPTKEWIKGFLDNKPEKVNVSLHICGADAENFCYSPRGKNFDETPLWEYIYSCGRIQLNFSVKMDRVAVMDILNRRSNYDFMYAVNRYHALNPGRYVIIQANKANKILNACLESEPSIEFLFDESRGNGKAISEYPEPIPHKYNGYAGGITPDNVLDILRKISNVVPATDEIWIDMESGVRTDNEFDLNKVNNVLTKEVKR